MFNSSFMCLAAMQLLLCANATQHLGRFSILANRTILVISRTEYTNEKVNLKHTSFGKPGAIVIACMDVDEPWQRIIFDTVHSGGGSEDGKIDILSPYMKYGVSNLGVYYTCGWIPRKGENERFIQFESLHAIENRHAYNSKNKNIVNDFIAYNGVSIDLDPDRRIKNDVLRHDIIVSNAGEYEVYVVRPDGLLDCRVKSVLTSRQMLRTGGDDPKPWEKRYTVPGDIDGPFAVVPYKKARYLITPTRAVARMVNARGEAEKKILTVYDESKIVAVVHDADEAKHYAFTATHFFEVAEPFVMKPHAVKKFDTSDGAAGLETAFHCARAVRGLPPVPFPAPPK